MSGVYGDTLQSGHIRLLDVRTRGAGSKPEFEGSFRFISLSDRPLPDFTAVSYCWNDWSKFKESELERIQFPGYQSLSLSPTLWHLFNSLQQNSPNFTVWIDFLCINQKNKDERESQVQQMNKVYSFAKNVLLWLGKRDSISEKAFHSMRNNRRDQSALNSIFLLLRRPWFQRVWVIQEITVSKKVQMCCGHDREDFDYFSDYIFDIWKYFYGWDGYEDDDDAVRGLWCVTRLFFIREDFKMNKLYFENLLQEAFHRQATDKRDMVYAFLGIADNRHLPPPNYTISEEELYIETAKALLCNGKSLDLLTLCGISRERSPSLPTWAPDLRYHSFSEPLVPCDRANWKAGGPLQVSPKIEAPLRLRLQIRPIDAVAIVCPPFNSESVADQQAAFKAIRALRLRVPGNISEDEWMDGLFSTLIWGLDIDDRPLESGEQWTTCWKHFKDWLKWLQLSSCEEDLHKIRRNEYHRAMGVRIDTWMAFMTHRGDFCIGPAAIEVGDIVCIVPGCRLPLVLRAKSTVSDEGTSRLSALTRVLVGCCYVERLMFGKAAELERPLEEVFLQ
ncbi:unnamed protein product [Clonostachys byssicola]|uniref:Heterokaryon incompatibility domain-containing protein n=1 Tax=Clonostachys byssicola TaxID=160290 RepID=A0A9N9TYR2_9HYPO|nr:unnamed protein product [Clonostachys byssicola]